MNRCALDRKPAGIVIDAAAFLLGMLAWVFLFWAPMFLLIVIFAMVKLPAIAGGVLFAILTIASVLFGLALRWLARGIVYREKVRMALAIALLLLWGIAPLIHRSIRPHPTSGRTVQEVGSATLLICAASILLFGFAESARAD